MSNATTVTQRAANCNCEHFKVAFLQHKCSGFRIYTYLQWVQKVFNHLLKSFKFSVAEMFL